LASKLRRVALLLFYGLRVQPPGFSAKHSGWIGFLRG
jgi:hypothetical protein